MTDLTDPKQVKSIQDTLQTLPIWHKDNMDFLEQIGGWYDFNEKDPNMILINHGKRQMLATIKTLLQLTPEQVAFIAQENNNAG